MADLGREVGGGAVYRDRGQLFYQFILRKDDPRIPSDKAALFEFLLKPVIDTYQEFGVPAGYKPVNDILSNGKKISGNGAAEIQERVVVVGNFLLDFNFEQMARVLRVPEHIASPHPAFSLRHWRRGFSRSGGDPPGRPVKRKRATHWVAHTVGGDGGI